MGFWWIYLKVTWFKKVEISKFSKSRIDRKIEDVNFLVKNIKKCSTARWTPKQAPKKWRENSTRITKNRSCCMSSESFFHIQTFRQWKKNKEQKIRELLSLVNYTKPSLWKKMKKFSIQLFLFKNQCFVTWVKWESFLLIFLPLELCSFILYGIYFSCSSTDHRNFILEKLFL